MMDQFKNSRDLTVIERDDTILSDDADEDRGATPFINVMTDLVGYKGSKIEPFAAKWLVHDITQIKHVFSATKAHAKGLFDELTKGVTVAVIRPSSKHNKTLAEALAAGIQLDPRVLTASPSGAGGGYDYYGHVEPAANQDWSDGPRGIKLDKVSTKLDELLKELHQGHVEKLTGHDGGKVKDLEKSGISIFSLDTLIGQS